MSASPRGLTTPKKEFEKQGADIIHLVDLDGAKAGEPTNKELIISIAKTVRVPVQVGGGIRTLDDAKIYLENHVDSIIVGTKAITNPEFITDLINTFGSDRIKIGVDVNEGMVAISGWEQTDTIEYQSFLEELRRREIKNLIATDITRDGTLTTPNFEFYHEIIAQGFNVIASGGVSDTESIRTLQRLGAQGAIIGKALYENRLTIAQANEAVDPEKSSNLTKRVIACLDVKDGKVVKGINFENLRDAGDPVELGKYYSDQGIDELVFLDITASQEKRQIVIDLVQRVAKEVFIPFTVGGGINSLDDIREILRAGADKVSINSAAVRNPQLIADASQEFGAQCIVVAIDAKKAGDSYKVFVKGGREETDLDALEWAQKVAELGAGEILLTSMDRDGTETGFENEITRAISDAVSIPVIASGGAGSKAHFLDTFTLGHADAALAASVFHFGEIAVGELKEFLVRDGIAIRK